MGHQRLFGVPLDSVTRIRKTIEEDELYIKVGLRRKTSLGPCGSSTGSGIRVRAVLLNACQDKIVFRFRSSANSVRLEFEPLDGAPHAGAHLHSRERWVGLLWANLTVTNVWFLLLLLHELEQANVAART